MPVEFTQYTDRDQRLVTSGDTGFVGVNMNTTPNLLPDKYLSKSINKRIINKQVADRGGHLAVPLFGMTTTSSSGANLLIESSYRFLLESSSKLLMEGAGGTINTPFNVSNIIGEIEYNTAGGDKAAIVFTTTQAYLVKIGWAPLTLTYPTGLTLSAGFWAVQANTTLIVFPGEGKTPWQYTGQYNTTPVIITDSNITPYQLSIPAITIETAKFTLVDQTAKAVGGTFPMPQGKHAIWFNDRLWVLVGNTLWPSDINDIYTYDWVNVFNIDRGSNDTAVASVAYDTATILVFKNRSVYSISNIDDTLNNTLLTKLPTGNTGCISPYAIETTGDDIWYYSGNAIHSIKQAVAVGRLQGSPVDLADPMKPIVSQINQQYANLCVSHIYNNRYYLACPINGSTENNCTLIYNFLNEEWETYDIPASSKFNVVGFFEMPFLGRSRLFAVSKSGYAFLYEYDDMDMSDRVSGAEVYPAQSDAYSRGYCGSNSEWNGQYYGAGVLGKQAIQATVVMLTLSPTYSIEIISDDAFNSEIFLDSNTRSNVKSTLWNMPDWDTTNVNLDYATHGRQDYSVSCAGTGVALGTGINLGTHQSYSNPYQTPVNASWFIVHVKNIGGNTILNHIDLSTNTKENSFDKS